MTRPTWDETWMAIAEIVARRGTCPKKQVGAVLVAQENTIISTGYNGAPSGLPHCLDVGCLLNPAGKCMRAVHAEMNALVRASQPLVLGSTLYVTHQPCYQCSMLIAVSEVARVVYLHAASRPTVPDALEFLASAGVDVFHYHKETK